MFAVGNSEVNTKMGVTRIRTPLRFYACPVTCKFDDDKIKNKGVIVSTAFSPL